MMRQFRAGALAAAAAFPAALAMDTGETITAARAADVRESPASASSAAAHAGDDTFLSLLAKHVVSGGPPKDGIPAVDKPQYTAAAEADEWLLPGDVVFGVDYGGFVAAFPQRILVWHEIVNETVRGERISITYCPLTGTAIGYKGTLAGSRASDFGVSGTLSHDAALDAHVAAVRDTGEWINAFDAMWFAWKAFYPGTALLR